MLIAVVLCALALMLLGLNIVFYSKNSLLCALGVVLAVGGLFLMLMSPAMAQDHSGHRPQDRDLHHKFYKTWKMPDNRAMSCCNDQDCEPSASKLENGSWYGKRGDEWVKVPDHKIERERDSPDGQSPSLRAKGAGQLDDLLLPARIRFLASADAQPRRLDGRPATRSRVGRTGCERVPRRWFQDFPSEGQRNGPSPEYLQKPGQGSCLPRPLA